MDNKTASPEETGMKGNEGPGVGYGITVSEAKGTPYVEGCVKIDCLPSTPFFPGVPLHIYTYIHMYICGRPTLYCLPPSLFDGLR